MGSIFSYIYWIFRPLVKVILRHITKLCELQRICYSTLPGAFQTERIEFSLNNSKRPEIRTMIKHMDLLIEERRFAENIRSALNQSVILVISCKKINPDIHIKFIKSLIRCLEHIWGYKNLTNEIKLLARTQYNSDNPNHEDKLIRLWNLLMPNTPLENRISKQWQDIGFQGDDPKTDFRGMGILGLDNLLFFARQYPSVASMVLSHSMHPTLGYAFAIVGINITSMAFNLFMDGCAKIHVYNISHSLPNILIFHNLYCYLFYEFDRFWIKSKPSSIMDFAIVREKFEFQIKNALSHHDTVFKLKCAVEAV